MNTQYKAAITSPFGVRDNYTSIICEMENLRQLKSL